MYKLENTSLKTIQLIQIRNIWKLKHCQNSPTCKGRTRKTNPELKKSENYSKYLKNLCFQKKAALL